MCPFLDSILGPFWDPFGDIKRVPELSRIHIFLWASSWCRFGLPWACFWHPLEPSWDALWALGVHFGNLSGSFLQPNTAPDALCVFGIHFVSLLATFLGHLWRTNAWCTKKMYKKGARREPALRAWIYVHTHARASYICKPLCVYYAYANSAWLRVRNHAYYIFTHISWHMSTEIFGGQFFELGVAMVISSVLLGGFRFERPRSRQNLKSEDSLNNISKIFSRLYLLDDIYTYINNNC